MGFELRDRTSGVLIRAYTSEGSALAFVRDVARLASREEAGRFSLFDDSAAGQPKLIAEGEALVRRALEDQVL